MIVLQQFQHNHFQGFIISLTYVVMYGTYQTINAWQYNEIVSYDFGRLHIKWTPYHTIKIYTVLYCIVHLNLERFTPLGFFSSNIIYLCCVRFSLSLNLLRYPALILVKPFCRFRFSFVLRCCYSSSSYVSVILNLVKAAYPFANNIQHIPDPYYRYSHSQLTHIYIQKQRRAHTHTLAQHTQLTFCP